MENQATEPQGGSTLQELLNTEEGKKQFQDLATANGFESPEQVKGLKQKNSELLSKLKAAPKRVVDEQAKNILEKYGLSDYNQLDSLLDQVKNPNMPDEVRELKNHASKTELELKKISSDFDSIQSELQSAEAALKETLTTNKLVNLLISQGCTKEQAVANSLYLLNKAQFEIIKEDNGARKAVAQDGSSLDDFFNSWVKTPEAQNLLPATKRNTGGGSVSQGGSAPNSVLEDYHKAVKAGDTKKAIALSRQLSSG